MRLLVLCFVLVALLNFAASAILAEDHSYPYGDEEVYVFMADLEGGWGPNGPFDRAAHGQDSLSQTSLGSFYSQDVNEHIQLYVGDPNDFSTLAGFCTHETSDGLDCDPGDHEIRAKWETSVFIRENQAPIRLLVRRADDFESLLSPLEAADLRKLDGASDVFAWDGTKFTFRKTWTKWDGLVQEAGGGTDKYYMAYPTEELRGEPGWYRLAFFYEEREGSDFLVVKVVDPQTTQAMANYDSATPIPTDLPLINYRSIFHAISLNPVTETLSVKDRDGTPITRTLYTLMNVNEANVPGGCYDGIDNDGDWTPPHDVKDSSGRNYPDSQITGDEDPGDDRKYRVPWNTGETYSYTGKDINGYDTTHGAMAADNFQPDTGEYGVDCLDPQCDGKPGPGGIICNFFNPQQYASAAEYLSETQNGPRIPFEWICSDNNDNDFDGKTDFDDPDCRQLECGVPSGTADATLLAIQTSLGGLYNPSALDATDACCGDDSPFTNTYPFNTEGSDSPNAWYTYFDPAAPCSGTCLVPGRAQLTLIDDGGKQDVLQYSLTETIESLFEDESYAAPMRPIVSTQGTQLTLRFEYKSPDRDVSIRIGNQAYSAPASAAWVTFSIPFAVPTQEHESLVAFYLDKTAPRVDPSTVTFLIYNVTMESTQSTSEEGYITPDGKYLCDADTSGAYTWRDAKKEAYTIFSTKDTDIVSNTNQWYYCDADDGALRNSIYNDYQEGAIAARATLPAPTQDADYLSGWRQHWPDSQGTGFADCDADQDRVQDSTEDWLTGNKEGGACVAQDLTLCDAIIDGRWPWFNRDYISAMEVFTAYIQYCTEEPTQNQPPSECFTDDGEYIPFQDFNPEESAGCEPETGNLCADGKDNDFDTSTDCVDRDCHGSIGPQETCVFEGELDCTNLQDDDADGLEDCRDSDCAGEATCTQRNPIEPLNKHTSFLCTDTFSPGFTECCDGSDTCLNTNLITKNKAVLIGTRIYPHITFNGIASGATTTTNYIWKTPSHPEALLTFQAPDVSGFDALELYVFAGAVQDPHVKIETYTEGEIPFNLADYATNKDGTQAYSRTWWLVRIPLTGISGIKNLKFTGNPLYVDNIRLVRDGEENACMYDGSWGDVNADAPACNSIVPLRYGSTGWIGTTCCGDRLAGGNPEYLEGPIAGCFAGNTIYVQQRAGDVLHDATLNNLLFDGGQFRVCSSVPENTYSLGVLTLVNDNVDDAFTIRGAWYCDPSGEWLSVADVNVERLIAGTLYGIGNQEGREPFTLFCDAEALSLNNPLGASDDATGNFCVLKYHTGVKERVYVGFQLQEGKTLQETVSGYARFVQPEILANHAEYIIPDDYCPVDAGTEFWKNCRNDNKVKAHHNDDFNAMIVTWGTTDFSSGFLASWWREIKEFFQRLFGFKTSETLPLPLLDGIPQSFKELYLYQDGTRSIRGVLEADDKYVIEYLGFPAADVAKLAATHHVSYVQTTGTNVTIFDDVDADKNAWQALTASLRPTSGNLPGLYSTS